MKSTAALVTLLAAGAVAQPHDHNRARHAHVNRGLNKRALVTEWETEWVTQTVFIDATTTISPSAGVFATTSEITSSTTSYSSSSSYSSSTSESSTSETSSSKTSTSESTSESISESISESTTFESITSSTSTSSISISTSSSTLEPEPTTSEVIIPEPEQKTTTSQAPPPPETTIIKAATAPTSAPKVESVGFTPEHSGFITYYDIGLGACGWSDSGRAPTGTSPDDAMVVAISYDVYFAALPNPNKMSLCGTIIEMESPDNPGVIAYGKISDACRACTTAGDLDVNIEGMRKFYPGGKTEAVGKGSITWRMH